MMETTILPRPRELRCRDRRLVTGACTLIMGIVNVTPDSFSGDGLDGQIDAAIAQAQQMVADGADIIDIGGESTRPGAVPVTAEEERHRVVPVIAHLRSTVSVPLSIDTRKPEVAVAALDAGAHIVNDVTGLLRSAPMAEVVAEAGAAVIAMHSPGEPWDITWPAHYEDVISEVKSSLEQSIAIAAAAGVADDQIVIDPGFGFGKGLQDNLTILRRVGEFRSLGVPVLLGTSRKSTIGRILGLPVEDRLEGSLATIPLAIVQGVDILRVHDVRSSVRVARMADAVVRGYSGS